VRYTVVSLLLFVLAGGFTSAKSQVAVDPKGQDEGAAINAAFQKCTAASPSSPGTSCVVNLAHGQPYRYSTTIVFPNSTGQPDPKSQTFVAAPILDCNGSTLTYTGTGEAFTVLGENSYKSGEIRNCTFSVTNSAATATIWSRLDFTVRHSTFIMGRTGVTFDNDRAHGGPGYTEESHWDDIQITVPPGGCGLTFLQDPSIHGNKAIGSFFYNSWTGIHFDLNGGGSRGVCLPDSSAEPVSLWGNIWVVNVNNGGNTDAVFWLGAASSIVRGTVIIHGEADSPAHEGYDVYAATPSSLFQNFGESYAVGFSHGYGAGVSHSNITFEGGPSVTKNDIFPDGAIALETESHEVGGLHPSRICKSHNAGSMSVELANYGPKVDCFFEIGYRNTDGTWHDVDIAGTSGKPFTSILWADGLSHNVGFGPGFSASSLPQSTQEIRGASAERDPGIGTIADGGVYISRSVNHSNGTISDYVLGGAPGQPSVHYQMIFRDYMTSSTAMGLDCFASNGVKCSMPQLTLKTAIVALHTPASSSEACTAGQFADDANYHYVCVAANTWKRVALSSF
jgi:hypothetical protein